MAEPSSAGAPNWSNQTIWTGDNLDVMRGMNSASVDLIYLDPPFNSNANYAAPIGSLAAGAAFKDTWGLDEINLAWHGLIQHDHPGLYAMLQAVRQIRGDSMMAYLIYMIPRLMEMHRLLKTTGSLYLHCDQTASHYLKMTMDAIFGKDNFRREITWKRTTSKNDAKRIYPNLIDTIFVYSAGDKFTFNPQYMPFNEIGTAEYSRKDADGRAYCLGDITAPGSSRRFEFLGVVPKREWRFSREKLEEMYQDGRIVQSKPGAIPRHKMYLDESKGVIVGNIWTDIKVLNSRSKERTGYPTQKPLALLRRIIETSSNPGDVVLDPFCGCATACIAAQMEGRQWVGIDISSKAAELTLHRCREELKLESVNIIHRTDNPHRTDLGDVVPYASTQNKNLLFGEQNGYCNACGTQFDKQHLTFDHIIPRSKGGTDHISNLQLLCGNCNSTKGNRSQEWLLARLLDKGFIRKQPAPQKHGG